MPHHTPSTIQSWFWKYQDKLKLLFWSTLLEKNHSEYSWKVIESIFPPLIFLKKLTYAWVEGMTSKKFDWRLWTQTKYMDNAMKLNESLSQVCKGTELKTKLL